MEIEVDIKAEDVMEHVKKAILDSALGKHIQESIEKVIQGIGTTAYGKDDVVTQAVRSIVREVIETTVQETFRGRITEQLKEKITEEFIDSCFTKLWESWVDKRW